MSNIISASLDEQTLHSLTQLQEEYGFSGRSETIRKAVQTLQEEARSLPEQGTTEATVLLVHDEAPIQPILHETEDALVKTHLHNHLSSHHCLDIFVLSGDASEVSELFKRLKQVKHVSQAKLVVL